MNDYIRHAQHLYALSVRYAMLCAETTMDYAAVASSGWWRVWRGR